MFQLLRGTYFQEGAEVKMEMNVEQAYKRSIETVVQWINDKVNTSKTQVFFRTFAPVHFRYVSVLFFLFRFLNLNVQMPYVRNLSIS